LGWNSVRFGSVHWAVSICWDQNVGFDWISRDVKSRKQNSRRVVLVLVTGTGTGGGEVDVCASDLVAMVELNGSSIC
jgi:hypothetical protein